MTLFWVCAIGGVTLAAAGLLLDGVMDALDGFDLGPDWFSLPVVGVGIGAFGITGLTVRSATGSTVVAVVIGAAVGLAFFAGTARLMIALIRSRSDPTPSRATVVGAQGKVVTPIDSGVRGEVVLVVAGHPLKLSATSDEELALGAPVVAIESVSDTTVIVMSQEKFWSA